MNLKQLPYFIAIAETGSLSAAARRTGVSQPAVSGYLHDLERELGIALFLRSGRRMTPTAAGNIYLEMAREVLGLQARTRTQIQARHNPLKQRIRVGVSPHRGAQALAAIYRPFNLRFPDTEILPMESYVGQAYQMLTHSEMDLAFSTAAEPLPQNNLHFLPLQKEELVLVLPTFHPLAAQASPDAAEAPSIDLAQFRDTPFVLMTPDSTVGQVSRQLFSQAGFSPVVVFQSKNVIMTNEMIRSGAGAGLIPAYYAKPDENVVYFRLSQPGYLTFCAVWAEGRALTEAERYLLYLKVNLWDRKNPGLLTSNLMPEEMRLIQQEFAASGPLAAAEEAAML